MTLYTCPCSTGAKGQTGDDSFKRKAETLDTNRNVTFIQRGKAMLRVCLPTPMERMRSGAIS